MPQLVEVEHTSTERLNAIDAADVDDRSTARIGLSRHLEMRNGVLHHLEDGSSVAVEVEEEVLERAGVGAEGATAQHAGAVHQRRQTAQGRHGRLDHALRLTILGQVCCHDPTTESKSKYTMRQAR